MDITHLKGDLPLMLAIGDLQILMRCGRTTAYQRTYEPTFPRPIAFSGSSYRWWRDEVLEWIESQRLTGERVGPSRRQRSYAVGENVQLPVPRPVRRAGGERP